MEKENNRKIIEEIAQRAKEEGKKVYIFAHQDPDGDALGASIAVQEYLKAQGIDAKYILTEPTNQFTNVLGNIEITNSIDAQDFTSRGKGFISLILDTGTVDFTQNKLFKLSDKKDIYVIDHHDKNKDASKLNTEIELGIPEKNYIRNPKAKSACEIVFGQMDSEKIDANIAKSLLLGITTDTGTFKYANAGTFEVLKKLLNFGYTYKELQMAMSEKKEIYPEIEMARIIAQNLETFEIGENTGIIMGMNFEECERLKKSGIQLPNKQIFRIQRAENIPFVATIAELKPGEYVCEFRSKEYYGNFNVCDLAQEYGGGGHPPASGVTLTNDEKKGNVTTLEEAIELVKSEAKNLYQNIEIGDVNKKLDEADLELDEVISEGFTNLNPEMAEKIEELINKGADYARITAIHGDIALSKILMRNELMSRIDANGNLLQTIKDALMKNADKALEMVGSKTRLWKGPTITIKLTKDDMEHFEKDYGYGQNEVLEFIEMFKSFNINTAGIILPNGRRASFDSEGKITENIQEDEKTLE